jgi:nucleotide-binding universal stress UspA family protein
MRTVLAAVDCSAAARPVLEAASAIAELTGAEVQAVHVVEGDIEMPEWLAAQKGVPLRVLAGPVEDALVAAVADDAVVAAVLGARGTPGGRRPVGHTAMQVVRRSPKPIAIVPPDAIALATTRMHRLLIPLEGDEASSRPVIERLVPLLVGEVELVVLHVFTNATAPRTLDRATRDLLLWGDEFVARFCPGATRIELRTGSVGAEVAAVSADQAVDLVVLSWSQDSSPGHAAVVRDVLGASIVPVLLLPVSG